MVGSHHVIEHAKPVTLSRFEQPTQVASSIPRKFQEKGSFVTPMVDVPHVAWQVMAISAWHRFISPSSLRWSPRYVKHSIDDGKKVEIAAIDPDSRSRPQPLSLMEFAGRCLISRMRSKREAAIRLNRPRSDQSCHHVMIA